MLGATFKIPSKAIALILVFYILSIAQSSWAQEIRNLKVNKSADLITISFDLKSSENPQELYEIGIYSSHDEYSTALDLMSGKVKDVFPGLGLKYVIDAKKLYTGFKGDVDFKVVATLVFVPLTLVTPIDLVKTKVGTSVTVMWKGGADNASYNLDYSKEGGTWTPIESKISDTRYTWNIPKKMPKGTYSIKLSSDQTKSKSVYSGNIVIKKKTSPLVIILPVAALVGAGVFFLLPKDTSTPCDPTDPAGPCYTGGGGDNLPGPPDPPTIAN